MDLMMRLLVWAQAQPGGTNPSSVTPLGTGLATMVCGVNAFLTPGRPEFPRALGSAGGAGILL